MKIANFKKQIFFFGKSPLENHIICDVSLRPNSFFKFFPRLTLDLSNSLGNLILACLAVLFPFINFVSANRWSRPWGQGLCHTSFYHPLYCATPSLELCQTRFKCSLHTGLEWWMSSVISSNWVFVFFLKWCIFSLSHLLDRQFWSLYKRTGLPQGACVLSPHILMFEWAFRNS